MPLYAQVTESVRHAVATGRLRPGEQLPTVRQLAVDLRINPNTVARAYTELERDGVICTRQGRGTFVSDAPSQARAGPDHRRLAEVARKALLEAQRLGFGGQELLGALQEALESTLGGPGTEGR
jgi:GntR family transcriptional regulator